MNESLRLLCVTQFFPPDYAATGQLIDELVRNLAKGENLEVSVFTGQPGYAFRVEQAPRDEKEGSLRIRRSNIARFWPKRVRGKTVSGVLFALRAFLGLLKRQFCADLLLITTAPPFLPILGYIFKIVFRLPYIVILYDMYPDVVIALGVVKEEHWIVKFWRWANRQIWLSAKNIIVLSDDMAKKVSQYCPEVADKIKVIHNWSDPGWIVPMTKKDNWFAQEYNLVDSFTVMYSGNMGRCHDMKSIIDAADRLKNQGVQFVLIGDGPQKPSLVAEVEHRHLKNVMFLPYQDKEVLPFSLTACDLSIITTASGMEGLVAPSKLYPTLAAGRPVAVICPSSCFLNELVTNAQCGGVVENGDGAALADFIRILQKDSEMAARMGDAARNYACSNFTLDIATEKYLEVITSQD